MGPKMSNTHDGDEKIPTPSTLGRIRVKPSRADFFCSFNSIFSQIYKANATVIVSLIKLKCIPILMYGLEALDLNKSNLNKLDNPLY